MNYKGIIIFILCIFVFLSITSVCAGEANETAIATTGETQIVIQTDELASIDNCAQKLEAVNEEPLANSISVSGNTFQNITDAINNACEGDTIYLEGHKYTGNGKHINIDKSLTIIGQNGTVLDAQGLSRIVYSKESNVIIKNVTFINGKTTANGGAIYTSENDCILSGCIFINNTGGDGGCIYGNSNMINISDCLFVNNSGKRECIYLHMHTKAIFSDCLFVNNSASVGGCILFDNGRNGEVSGCIFVNNSYPKSCIHQMSGEYRVSNSSFQNNSYFRVNNEELKLTLTLEAHLDYSNAIKGSINNTNIRYWNGSSYVTGDNPNFGTVKIANRNISFEIRNSTGLVDNVTLKTDRNGQAFYDYSGLNRGNYDYNAYYMDDETRISTSGSIDIEIGDFNIIQKQIDEAPVNSIINLTDNYTFTKGMDDNLKNGIKIDKTIIINGNGHTIDANNASRIFEITAENVLIKNITFINGRSSFGGAIIIKSNGCTISNCTFTDNIADFGGAIRCEGWDTSITNCSFENNAALQGGAIQWFEAVGGTIADCSFKNNKATENGSAIYWFHSDGSISKSSFISNHADKDGGAIYCSGNFTSVTGCLFINNTAAKSIIHYQSFYKGSTFNDNIFLNHEIGSEISFSEIDESANIDYNWFGNTAVDYDIMPEFNNANTTVWLFLNAAANPNPVKFEDTSDIVYKLYAYDKASQKQMEYDNSLLKPVNLTVTSTDSKFNATSIELADTLKYIKNSKKTDTITASLENVALAIELGISEMDTPISIDVEDVEYLQTANITVSVDANATGNITVTLINGSGVIKSANLRIVTGKVNLSVDNLACDNYTVNAFYHGDGTYHENTTSEIFKVEQITPIITIDPVIVSPNENATITINITSRTTGNVTVKVNSKNYTGEIKRGIAVTVIDQLDSGKYLIEAYYPGDRNFTEAYGYGNLTVKKNLEIKATADPITLGKNATVDVTGLENATGNISVRAGDGIYIDRIDMGKASVVIPGLIENTTAEIHYRGDDNYCNASTSILIVVNPKEKKNATMIVDAAPITVGENATVSVTLPEDATGDVTVGSEVVPLVNGTASVILTNLPVGNTTVPVIYSGDDNYNPISESAQIIVNKKTSKLAASDVTTTYKISKDLVITLTDAANTAIGNVQVTVDLNGIKNYTTDANGQIKIAITGLTPKTYTAKITFGGTENYTTASAQAKVIVKKATPKMTAKAKTFKDTDKTKKYIVILKDNKGQAIKNAKVSLKVKGKTYTAKTNTKGQATFNLKKLTKTGKYKAVITYNGNQYYNKLSKKATITVKNTFKTVSKGSKDHAMVKKIQRALKNKGYYLSYNGHYLMVDGIYEIYTKWAVKEFQKDNHLKVTGSVDYNTAKKLKII